MREPRVARAVLGSAMLLLVPILPAAAKQPAPAVDLAALAECRSGVGDYNTLALKIAGDPNATKAMGWVEVRQPNTFLKEYQLPKAITVFGHKTTRIAFGSAALMAILDGVAPKTLAATIGLTNVGSGEGKVLFAKTVKEEKDDLATPPSA